MTGAAAVERFAAMGTRVELHVFGAGADRAVLAAAVRAVEMVDDALTIHRPSPATALNEALLAGRETVVGDAILLDALVASAAAHAATDGLFDPAADARFARTGWADIVFDPAAARIAVTRPLALDFGGIGKGLALDRAGDALRAAGVVSACLSAGESSIAVVGEHPLGGGWPFAVPHPLRPDAVLVEVELIDQSLSISATVGAGMDAPERAAMIRPGDGAVVTAARCAVVVDRLGARAEAISTALIVADDDRARRLRNDAPGMRWRFDLSPDVAAEMDMKRMYSA